ncbi:MAG: PBSX family phage terminase large subunit [Candidatus Aenigmarchaeota archaeon]|nr:PBSX family phage terminase large subunit [Candidatus Aenigmarchaeota archaeon]
MNVNIKATKLFEWLSKQKSRIVILLGGAGSSKSYSIAQYLILKAYSENNRRFLITRKTLPSLRLTCLKLILQLLEEYQLPYEINRSELIITTPTNSELIFKSIDQPEKIKSSEFNYIWIEEATEITLEDFRQLNLRLRRQPKGINQMFLSFNPIDENHWLKTELIDKLENVVYHKSNYKDNPFLSEEYIKQLEDLINQDKNYYRIYTLGEWGVLENIIYQNWETVDSFPESVDEIIYGLDFGYNNETALVKIGIKDDEFFLKEEIYETKLTNEDLIRRLESLKIKETIYADSAEPARIEEIYRAGFDILPSEKSVKDGIDFIKRKKLYITKDSINLIKEIRGYSYKKDKNGNVLEEPVKFRDHLMDAMRYAIYTHCKNESKLLIGSGGRFYDI